MKFGIRGKFVGILILAIVLPIGVAIVAIDILGNRHYRDAEGRRFVNRAAQMTDFVDVSVGNNVDQLTKWLEVAGFYERLEEINADLPPPDDTVFHQRILDLEARWPDLAPDSDEIRPFLSNSFAEDLKQIQLLNPLFAEIFVTDRYGQLVASTNKTTDYWQANEKWWQRGTMVPFGDVHIEGINFDESAEVYSFDMAIPIRDPKNPQAPVVGVVKGVLQASPIFLQLADRISVNDTQWKWVMNDGRILFGRDREPLHDFVSREVVEQMGIAPAGWMISPLLGEEKHLVGYTTLPWRSVTLEREPDPPSPQELKEQLEAFAGTTLTEDVLAREAAPLHVVVYQPTDEVFAPVQAQLRNVTYIGVMLLLAGAGAGFFLTHTGIIQPVRRLQKAARNISSSARLEEMDLESSAAEAAPLRASTVRVLDRVAQIRGNDELGELARDFEAMARRVLRYHENLEADLAAKSSELNRDLTMAREFQQSLMPRQYPAIPSTGKPAALKLNFHHVYLPASTVGGDFFNVIKLSDDRAGIFIADVMGHGASSALVTAIVGTLLQDLAYEIQDPAHLMTRMNRHFHLIMNQCEQLVFVSAFYMIVDTRQCTASYASAGHPSPFVADRRSREIAPLFSRMYDNPALGLLRDSAYSNSHCKVGTETLFILFTDGIIEALNSHEEEFGPERLRRVVEANLQGSVAGINDAVVRELTRFTGASAFLDDICLLTVENAENPHFREDSAVGGDIRRCPEGA